MQNSSDLKKNIIDDTVAVFNSIRKKEWIKFKNKNIFLTGGTGPFGFWLLNTFIFANNKLSLNAKIYVLTRNKKKKFFSLIKDKSIKVVEGDIRNFKFNIGKIDFIIHGATTTASETFKKQDPFEKFSVLYDGTKRLIKFAKKQKVTKILFLSSGAVYGNRDKNISFKEDMKIAPSTNDLNFDISVLAEAKRCAEMLLMIFSKNSNCKINIARCFSFVGPFMPLNIHYAIGNFLKDAIQKKKIIINGNPKTKRSYLYFSDLTIILWKILLSNKNQEIYNVGSDNQIDMLNLAKKIKKISPKISIEFKNKIQKEKPNFYVPNINKIKKHFGFKIKNKIDKAIKKTYLEILNNSSFYKL
jgi:nucleoside-diphosphate-sugar epimerase